MYKKIVLYIAVIIGCVNVPVWAAQGQWQEHGKNIGLGCGSNEIGVIADGNNGAIVVWSKSNTICAARISGLGYSAWNPQDGVTVIMGTNNDVRNPRIVSDNAGGAIIAWADGRNHTNYNLYTQKLDNFYGGWCWAANGVAIRNLTSFMNDTSVQMIADGTGGAILAWLDKRNSKSDIYAQRVSNSGVTQWTANGVIVYSLTTLGLNGYNFSMASDGNGGVIIAWEDSRSGTARQAVYAQRLDSTGTVKWATNGIAISTGSNDRGYMQMIPDGNGGAIITWEDKRSGNYDIYAQKINGDGTLNWNSEGIPLCTIAPSDQRYPWLTTNGSDGAIVVWRDNRTSSNTSFYVQKLNDSGTTQWTANGVLIRQDPYGAFIQGIVSDGSGGAIVGWLDSHSGSFSSNPNYTWAQRIDASGSLIWPLNGFSLTDQGMSNAMQMAADDNNGGALLVWGNSSLDPQRAVYVQKIVRPHPQILSITSPAVQGTLFHATITGNYFQDDRGNVTAIKLTRTASADIIASNLTIVGSTSLTCDFDLSSASLGDWFLVVSDNFSQKSAETVPVTILQPTSTPTVTPTITPLPTASATTTATPSPTTTQTPLPQYNDFNGQIIAPKYFYVAPNPTKGVNVNFKFFLQQAAEVEIRIYTPQGSHVLTKSFNYYPQGWNTCVWNASGMANGVYFYIVEAKANGVSEKLKIKKIALIK